MPLSVEGKMVVRLRDLLRADATLAAMYGDRIYDSHVSTIYQPTFPAISLTVIQSSPLPYLAPAVEALIQVDLWHQENPGVKEDLYRHLDAARAVLHLPRANYDSISGLTLMELRELTSGALLHEADTNLWHLAKRFRARGL